jgi:hypothetical protein
MKKLSKHYISLPLYIIPALPPGGCGKAGRFATSKKKGDFFRLIWAEIFLHKSLTDSGISHRFLRLFSFYTIARRFEYLHICGIFLHRCRRRVSCYLLKDVEISNIEEGRALNSWLIGLKF